MANNHHHLKNEYKMTHEKVSFELREKKKPFSLSLPRILFRLHFGDGREKYERKKNENIFEIAAGETRVKCEMEEKRVANKSCFFI